MYIVVGIGGVMGAIFRFIITYLFMTFGNYFAIGILCINLLGCFLLGYLQGLARVRELPDWLVIGLGTGFIGAFTTFSTFSMEVIYFLEHEEYLLSIFYILVSSIGGFFLVSLGYNLPELRDKDV